MILIAGGTGLLGSRVARRLVAVGDAVRIVTRHPDGPVATELRDLGVEVVRCDVCQAASVHSVVSGADVLVISVQALAGPGTSRRNNPHTLDDEGVRELIRAAADAHVRHVVYISIAGASPDAGPEFVRIKHDTERAVQRSGMTWTIIRPAAFMEVWSSMIGGPVLKGDRAMVFGDGNNPVNFVSADDVAEFVVLAIKDPAAEGQTLTVGGPDNLTLNEVVELFAKAANTPAKVRKLPVGVMKAVSAVMSPINPGLSRQMGMGAWMATSDQRVDMTKTLEHFPVELTHLQDIADKMKDQFRVGDAI